MSHLLALAAVLLGVAGPIAAQDPSRPPAVAERPDANGRSANGRSVNDTDSASPSASETEAQRRQRTRVVEAASLLLLVLVAAGVFLIAAVIVWGARARRLVRTPLPSQSEPDRLWYLRKKPPAAPDPTRKDEDTK